MYPGPFAPIYSTTVSAGVQHTTLIAPTSISASTTTSSATALPGNQQGDSANVDIRVENTTNGWAFSLFGDGSQGAATANNGIGVAPGAVSIIRVPQWVTSVTVILAAGATAGPVRYTRGLGGSN